MNKDDVCVVCRITKEKAEERGDLIEKLEVHDEYILRDSGVVLSSSSFVCDACKIKIADKLSGGKMSSDMSKIVVFADYIGSSAALFGLTVESVVQASFNVLMSGLDNIPVDLRLRIYEKIKHQVDRKIDKIRGSTDKSHLN